MISRDFKRFRLAALPALAMVFQLAFAEAPAHKHTDAAEQEYQAKGARQWLMLQCVRTSIRWRRK